MKMLALDTNIAVDILNGRQDVISVIKQHEIICLPVTVCGELLFGAKNSGNRVKNETKYQAFINSCVILDINTLVADEYAEIRLLLKQQGKPVPENDIWIAAICVVNGISLISHDRHFEHVINLQLIKMN